MIIKSKEYFNLNINKSYEIKVVETTNDINNMISYFKNFINTNDNRKIVGLDFEFNASPEGKKIALFQINLESSKKECKIFLFYPPDLNNDNIKILKNLLTNNEIIKVLHGAESLDIPYLFKNIFVSSNERNKFCNNLFDTRYMCEYLHLENKINAKCKIYHILKQLKVINQKQLDMLLKNEEEMGPIYEIIIDVRKLNKNTMLYSAFDVLYLPSLLERFPNNVLYMKLIPQFTCFNYIDRYDEIFVKPFSNVLNKANNYFLKTKTRNIKLIDIFNLYFYWVTDDKGILLNLMEINYFKKFIETFIKFIVYKYISSKYIVYEKNNLPSNINKKLIFIENNFREYKLNQELEDFFSNLRRQIKNDINR